MPAEGLNLKLLISQDLSDTYYGPTTHIVTQVSAGKSFVCTFTSGLKDRNTRWKLGFSKQISMKFHRGCTEDLGRRLWIYLPCSLLLCLWIA